MVKTIRVNDSSHPYLRCRHCGEVKPIEDFPFRDEEAGILDPDCKLCYRQRKALLREYRSDSSITSFARRTEICHILEDWGVKEDDAE